MECKECGRILSNINGLSKHVKSHGISPQDYYDKYLLISKNCANPKCSNITTFGGLGKGYNTYCSKSCASSILWTNENHQISMSEKFSIAQKKYLENNTNNFFDPIERAKYVEIQRSNQSGFIYDPKSRQKALISSHGYKCESIVNYLNSINIKYELEFFIEDYTDSNGTTHYRFYDLFIPEFNLLVELDGSIHRKCGLYDIVAEDSYKDYLALSKGYII